jgi:cell division topological specificity factor
MILDFLEKLFSGSAERNSRQEVKNRLKLVLAHDRAAIEPDMLEAMRREILEVVSRYVELDAEEMELSLDSSDRMTILVANLPIRKVNPQFYTVKDETITGEELPAIEIDETLIGEPDVSVPEESAATESPVAESGEAVSDETNSETVEVESAAEMAKARLENVVIQDSNETLSS